MTHINWYRCEVCGCAFYVEDAWLSGRIACSSCPAREAS